MMAATKKMMADRVLDDIAEGMGSLQIAVTSAWAFGEIEEEEFVDLMSRMIAIGRQIAGVYTEPEIGFDDHLEQTLAIAREHREGLLMILEGV